MARRRVNPLVVEFFDLLADTVVLLLSYQRLRSPKRASKLQGDVYKHLQWLVNYREQLKANPDWNDLNRQIEPMIYWFEKTYQIRLPRTQEDLNQLLNGNTKI